MVDREELARPVWSNSSMSHYFCRKGLANICLPNTYSFPSSCELHFFPLKLQIPTWFCLVQKVYLILSVFGISMSIWNPGTYKIKSDFLLLICLKSISLLVQLEGPWGDRKLLPLPLRGKAPLLGDLNEQWAGWTWKLVVFLVWIFRYDIPEQILLSSSDCLCLSFGFVENADYSSWTW